jgi:hypothetical protein
MRDIKSTELTQKEANLVRETINKLIVIRARTRPKKDDLHLSEFLGAVSAVKALLTVYSKKEA